MSQKQELPVQICEALNVQHVDLVDEEHAGHELGHTVVDILVHHLKKSFSSINEFNLIHNHKS